MSDTLKTYVFSLVLCVVCGLLLTAASSGLKPFQQKNIALDKQKNILKSVGLVTAGTKYSGRQLEKMYTDNIKCIFTDEAGNLLARKESNKKSLPICLYLKDNQVQAYIIPIETRGLWGKISGYLALEDDGMTVSGFTVYKHNETPGLGGEIEKNWFQKNFVGKKIIGKNGEFKSISIAKGAVDQRLPEDKKRNTVDGISGATLTGQYLEKGLENILTAYEPVSVRFRNNRKVHVPEP